MIELVALFGIDSDKMIEPIAFFRLDLDKTELAAFFRSD